VCTLYGLKSSEAAWRRLLQNMILGELKFAQTKKADRDVYIRKVIRLDGFEYYEMILIYVDDLLSTADSR
jgi:hypothetical protein